jgi:hypothetical protein
MEIDMVKLKICSPNLTQEKIAGNRIQNFLNQPFPYEYNLRTIFGESAGIGLFIFLFLTLFKPFEAGKYSSDPLVSIAINLGFGLISFVVGFAYDLAVPKLFPKLFFSEQIRIRNIIPYILGLLFLIGLGNAFYFHAVHPSNTLLQDVLGFQFYTVAIGFIPVVFVLLLQNYSHLQEHIRKAESINRGLDGGQKQGPDASHPEQPLTLTSDNEKETIRVPSSRLLFVKSAGNYVEVFTDENGTVRKHLLRNTIKAVSDRLADDSMILRCHRAYLVNVLNIGNVTGDSQGFRVTIRNTEHQVPVSRGYLKHFKQHIDRISSN